MRIWPRVVTYQEIEARAYWLWQQRVRFHLPGDPWSDWSQAIDDVTWMQGE